jgi:hypothetical protein
MALQVDPEAAKIVFESGLNIVMVPLEVTHTALVTIEVMASIMNRRPTPFLLLIREILSYFSDTYLEVFGFRDPPLHDPCAVFAVIQPEAFKVPHSDACKLSFQNLLFCEIPLEILWHIFFACSARLLFAMSVIRATGVPLAF